MKLEVLVWLQAYAWEYFKEDWTIENVIKDFQHYIMNLHMSSEELTKYLETNAAHYQDMKKYGLEDEIREEMSKGLTFWEACEEWDI